MSIKVNILTDFFGDGLKKAIAQFKQLETTGQKAQFALQKAAIPAAAALSGLTVIAKKSITAASDLGEAQAAVGVIFGESADEIEKFSRTAAKNIGQSRRQVLQAAQTFGAFGKQAGLSGDALTKFSTDFVALASDLASFKNTSPEEAITAIGAALRGEAEPIRRYNVLLDDATLRQKAVELQLIKTTKEALTPQNKVLAAQAAIYEQTRDAQGDFIRTSDSLANSSRTLTSQVEDVAASFGEAFIPAVERALPLAKDFADWAAKNPAVFQAVAIAIGGIATATLALNAAMALNPYVILAGAIVGVSLAADKALEKLERMNGIIGKVAGFLGRGLLGDIGEVFGTASKAANGIDKLTKAQIENAEINQLLSKGLIDLTNNENKFSKTLGEGSKKVDERLAKIKALRKEFKQDFADALETAKDKLKDAQIAFDDFAKSVSQSISSTFSFSNAQAEANTNSKNLTDALARHAKARERLNRAYEKGEAEEFADALVELREAVDEVTAAQSKPMTFFESLTQQANKTKEFGVILNRLLAAGLKGPAFQQVLDAGVDLGTQIGNELLNGGAEAIATANTLAQEVKTLADNVGLNAATQFKQAGIDAGNAMIEGINQAISQFKVTLKSKNLSKKQLKKLRQDFGLTVDFVMSGGNIPALAEGGIVTKPTLALIGEAGPEAVVPLNQYGSAGTGQTNVTINVNGGDPQAVVDALRRYMVVNGPVPIKVA